MKSKIRERSLIGLAIVVALFWTIANTNGQYETPNNWCGGWFRYIRGSINFTFYNSTSETEKLCMWTISPTAQYRAFLITRLQLNIPQTTNCDQFALSFTGYAERAKDVTQAHTFCTNASVPVTPFVINSTVLIVALKVLNVQWAMSNNVTVFIEWQPRAEADRLPAVRLIETYYSWGRPTIDPLPYFAAGFMSNGVKTFVWPKANFSDGSNYEFHMTFHNIKSDYCWTWPSNQERIEDFILLGYIDNQGRIRTHHVYEHENITDTETFISNYGFFIIQWGGTCSIGGGGSMQLYYESIRIS